jgi:hypothetical protein
MRVLLSTYDTRGVVEPLWHSVAAMLLVDAVSRERPPASA